MFAKLKSQATIPNNLLICALEFKKDVKGWLSQRKDAKNFSRAENANVKKWLKTVNIASNISLVKHFFFLINPFPSFIYSPIVWHIIKYEIIEDLFYLYSGYSIERKHWNKLLTYSEFVYYRHLVCGQRWVEDSGLKVMQNIERWLITVVATNSYYW